MGIRIGTEIDVSDLAFAIVHYGEASHEDIFQLIVDLDEAVCDLEFTVRLRDHLSAVVTAEAEAEDAD